MTEMIVKKIWEMNAEEVRKYLETLTPTDVINMKVDVWLAMEGIVLEQLVSEKEFELKDEHTCVANAYTENARDVMFKPGVYSKPKDGSVDDVFLFTMARHAKASEILREWTRENVEKIVAENYNVENMNDIIRQDLKIQEYKAA